MDVEWLAYDEILEWLREQVRTCGKTHYRIADELTADAVKAGRKVTLRQPTIYRFMQGSRLELENASLLCEFFGRKLVLGLVRREVEAKPKAKPKGKGRK